MDEVENNDDEFVTADMQNRSSMYTTESDNVVQQAELQIERATSSGQFANAIVGSGHVFTSMNEFRSAMYQFSLHGRFQYKYERNKLHRATVVCKIDRCPWRVCVNAIRGTGMVQVHTFKNIHNHSVDDPNFAKVSIRVRHAATMVDDVIRATPSYLPRQLCKDFERQHGIHMTYPQAWKLKEKCKERIHGKPQFSYKLLPWLCNHLVELNPGTMAECRADGDGHFAQMFVAHGVSIHGFRMGCRPIVVIDSTHLSGPYKGVMYSASAYDADDGLFPLAYGIFTAENQYDWLWFLARLKLAVSEREVVIISDRHPGIISAVEETFGKECHVHCYRHVKENFSSFLNKHNTQGRKGKENAMAMLDKIAYARLENDYLIALRALRNYNEQLGKWVEDNNPQHWAISQFKKMRWDKLTSNLAESYNAWMKEERHHNISGLFIEQMDKVGALLFEHYKQMLNWNGVFGPKCQEKLSGNITRGEMYTTIPLLGELVKVTSGSVWHEVDLRKKTCSCKEWEMTGIPCVHACASIRRVGEDLVNFVDDAYKLPTQQMIYSGVMHPITSDAMPCVQSDGKVVDALGNEYPSMKPPRTRRPPGRPKKKRIESQLMDKRTVYCSRCNQPGHNRASCKNPIV